MRIVLPALFGCAVFCGCRTMITPFSGMFGGQSEEDEIRRMTDTGDVRGPLQRMLTGRRKRAQSLGPAAGRDEYEQAMELYKAKKYKAAESKAEAVASKYKNSPVREDALFLVAEAQFEQKRYSWAQDSYDLLVKEFPSTRYQERRNKRLFTIARYWLQDPQYVTADNVKPAAFNPNGSQRRPTVNAKRKTGGFDITRTVPIFPNFWDRTRPVFDTEGRALQALKSIWQNDPTGSLADDALMLEAGYHLRNGNYLEAGRIYDILRDEYAKSRHAENAYVLGAYVKQASYQGPQYDPKVLQETAELKKSTLRLYPKHPDRERMLRDLRRINIAKAASDWDMVRFYRRKNRPKSVAVYCREILRNYPETEYADRAQRLLKEMGEPVDPRDALRAAAKPKTSEPRLFRVPKVTLPALPRLPFPSFGFGKSNTPERKTTQNPNEDVGRAKVR